MPVATAPFPVPSDVTIWSDDATRDVLGLLAHGTAEATGLRSVTVHVVRGEDMVCVAAAGTNAPPERVLGLRVPVVAVRAFVHGGRPHGRCVLLSHRDLPFTTRSASGEVQDLLVAPLRDSEGGLLGELVGCVPAGAPLDPRRLDLLQRGADQIERALRIDREREALLERSRISATTGRIVRLAASGGDLDAIVEAARDSIAAGFCSTRIKIRVYPDGDHEGVGAVARTFTPLELQSLRTAAEACWRQRRAVVFSDSLRPEGLVEAAMIDVIDGVRRRSGAPVALCAPIGAGEDCFGHFIVARSETDPPFSAEEISSALEIGHDLGQAVVNVRTQVRNRRALAELSTVAEYKSRLLATVSHEMRGPLAVINGHLELLRDHHDGDRSLSVVAMTRATRRLVGLVENLLLLAELEDDREPVAPRPTPVLPAVVEAVEMAEAIATGSGVSLTVTGERAVSVCCDPEPLDTVLGNLIGNAVKYSHRGGRVRVRVALDGDEVVVEVADDGLGIAPEDRDRLFGEFFRSTNPEALRRPGSGLGLAISQRIARRYGGRIDVSSKLGRGSTFTLRLPSA